MKNKINCIDQAEAILLVGDKSVDLLITDPPYGISFKSNHRKVKHKKIANDNNLEWLPMWCHQISRVLKDDSHAYIFCSWHNIDVFKMELSKHLTVKNILIWHKNNTGMGDLEGDYAPQYEMIIFCSNGNKKLIGGRDSNIIKSPRTNNVNHPTEKPVDLISFFIEKSSEKGDLVLDTFAGSFSTARACIAKQRDFLCFEIDPKYCYKARLLLSGSMKELF